MLTTEIPVLASQLPVRDIRERRVRRGSARDRGRRLEIGLVNNMPDAAIAATERQFTGLLEAACGGFDVTLRLYALDEVPRNAEARAAMSRSYHDPGHLRFRPPDALIITGAEPRAPTLPQEPYWSALTSLIDWADDHTTSTLLSCLAAHAGVLHLDSIERTPMPEKCSGVFGFEIVGDHRLVWGLDAKYAAPHSRLNGLDERALRRDGYFILTRSDEAGVDVFVKDRSCLFVFVQGHPEYDDDSLAREFRRDVARFLRGERAAPPALPANYYSGSAGAALLDFCARARRDPRPALMDEFPTIGAPGPGDARWRKSGVQLYRNWIRLIAERKAARLAQAAFAARRSGG
jgi:homoserine O-succinyltransferase/O-acetyltransferase